MSVIRLNEKILDKDYFTNPETGFLCRYIKSDTERFKLHRHNYYEVFLMLKGTAKHTVNNNVHILSSGDMLFIRDYDCHDYCKHISATFDFINLAFRKECFDDMIRYLGDSGTYDALFDTSYPPLVKLTESEKNKVFFDMSELINTDDISYLKLKFKKLILDIFTSYFLNYTPAKSECPLWLEVTYEKMKKPRNFIAGIERMYELSGVSHEHMSRMMKKHYGVSPTDFILDLRLTHAANLLISSNLDVTDICYECGFNNAAWFYKAFRKKYNISPLQYRKTGI